MEFTGERFVPTEQGRIRLEHYHRYAAVLDLVKAKTVLDVASGEGYGSSLMATVAQSVVGVDISDEAIAHAAGQYVQSNLTFQQGSATALAFPDAQFDVVVSFETVEHLLEQEQMIAQLRRVLKPDGILVISSPNRPIYSEESGEENHFHVKELDFSEFDVLLKTQFPAVVYLGQRIMMNSVLQPLDGEQSHYQAWHDTGTEILPHAGKLVDPVYFLAVCGAQQAAVEARIGMSILNPDSIDLVKHYVGFAAWAKSLDREMADKNAYIKLLQVEDIEKNSRLHSTENQLHEKANQLDEKEHQLHEKEHQLRKLNTLLAEKDRQSALLTKRFEDTQRALLAVTGSISWKLTMPVRELRRWVFEPVNQLKKYARFGLRTLKKIVRILPIENETKQKVVQFLAKYFPKLLTGGGVVFEQSMYVNSTDVPLDVPEKIVVPEQIEIWTSANPLVSIIIPIYGQIHYTLRCLASIAYYLPEAPVEVIVVDDCSPDDSFAILGKVKGIRLIRNEKNQGFIRSCNAGANVARGEYVYFLNNDTEVTPRWLDELVHTFHDFPGTGFVGSKLIYPDGSLQEAGGIIWQDGSAWNLGRHQHPSAPPYNYVREVDYCSGASIIVPKKLFMELGGFDEHYLPAYCEDSDLALKIRDRGYRVLYQPLSTVIHYEGITSGTDLKQGAKAYQIQNSQKLTARWKDLLATHRKNGVDPDSEKDRMLQKRVLIIEHCTPTPDRDAGSVSVFNIILLLRDMGYQITFIPEDNFLFMPDYSTKLQRLGVEVIYFPFCRSVEQHVDECGDRYDLAFLFRPRVVEKHLATIQKYCPSAKTLFYTHDIHHIRLKREAVLFEDADKHKLAEKMKEKEYEAINTVDATIVVSTTELDLLKPDFPDKKMHILPLILAVPGTTKKYAERSGVVFVGGFQHIPNVDAVKFFVNEIMPALRIKLPGIKFHIVGSNVTDEINALAADDIEVVGFIEELNPYLDQRRLAVAPLRFGAGIKGKVGTAMAAGLPSVASSIAVEGMTLIQDEHILVADDPIEFADQIVRLYQDETLWCHISAMGIDYANATWGMKVANEKLQLILDDIDLPKFNRSTPLSET